jgi:hypothetical protein
MRRRRSDSFRARISALWLPVDVQGWDQIGGGQLRLPVGPKYPSATWPASSCCRAGERSEEEDEDLPPRDGKKMNWYSEAGLRWAVVGLRRPNCLVPFFLRFLFFSFSVFSFVVSNWIFCYDLEGLNSGLLLVYKADGGYDFRNIHRYILFLVF